MADVPETRARQVLLKKIEKLGQSGVKAASGVAQPTISQLATRSRLPGRRVATALEKVGIKAKWWDEPPIEGAA